MMINELKKQESELKKELETLKKHSNAIHMKLIRLEKWMLKNGYERPFSGDSDLNIIKYHKLVEELSHTDVEINDVKLELKELKYDLFYLETGFLISAYKGYQFKVRLIDNTNKNIEEIYCNKYDTYLGHENMVIVYELIRGIGQLPYEKIVHIKED